jgi:hypothetical protein
MSIPIFHCSYVKAYKDKEAFESLANLIDSNQKIWHGFTVFGCHKGKGCPKDCKPLTEEQWNDLNKRLDKRIAKIDPEKNQLLFISPKELRERRATYRKKYKKEKK